MLHRRLDENWIDGDVVYEEANYRYDASDKLDLLPKIQHLIELTAWIRVELDEMGLQEAGRLIGLDHDCYSPDFKEVMMNKIEQVNSIGIQNNDIHERLERLANFVNDMW